MEAVKVRKKTKKTTTTQKRTEATVVDTEPTINATIHADEEISTKTDEAKDCVHDAAAAVPDASTTQAQLELINEADETLETETETEPVAAPDMSTMPTAPAQPDNELNRYDSVVAQAVKVASSYHALPVLHYPNLSTLSLKEQNSEHLLERRVPARVQPSLERLYECVDLKLAKQFETQFISGTLTDSYDEDALYVALRNYYNIQSKLSMNIQDEQKYRKRVKAAVEDIWVKENVRKSAYGYCGDGIKLTEIASYEAIKVDEPRLESATSALTELSDLTCFTYSTNLMNSKTLKFKIDKIINEILSAYPTLGRAGLQATASPDLYALRRAISIVFSFVRKPRPNGQFESDLKGWLNQLIAVQLLFASREDHWFLLCHVLRCPSGCASWTASYIQLPCASVAHDGDHVELPLPLDSPELGICMSVLQLLLSPIEQRSDFLSDFTQDIVDPIKDEQWILVDTDGELNQNMDIRECDIIAFLNQVPFERLFSSTLCVPKFPDGYVLEPDVISGEQVLKAIAFLSRLVHIVGDGMVTYSQERYKQLSKRLGRLLQNILNYICDFNELYKNNKLKKDLELCAHIDNELGILLLRVCSYIYRSKNIATWQYFPSLPFYALNSNIVWNVFYFLSVGFPVELAILDIGIEDFQANDFWIKFNVANADVTAEGLYYLLQAFFEIANQRDYNKDWQLIKTICVHIFNIGFINKTTREICYKSSRDMLVNITLAHVELISCLLLQIKLRCQEAENLVFLLKSLPLANWQPDMESLEIISHWLLHHDLKSLENMLARVIISHLNWGFDGSGQLFLSHDIHVRMGCLVAHAFGKHVPENTVLTELCDGTAKSSSPLAGYAKTTRQHFANWCWKLIYLLRLHLMDQHAQAVRYTLQNPTQTLTLIADLSRFDVIEEDVQQGRPLAIFVAMLISSHGHIVPLICQQGFPLLQVLLKNQCYTTIVRCLQLIVPLFIESSDALAKCEGFQTILNALINTEKTYIRMATELVFSNGAVEPLKLLDEMIHHQILSCSNIEFYSSTNLITVWLHCLLELPEWHNSNAVFLVDNLLCLAFQLPGCWQKATDFFLAHFRNNKCEDWKSNSNGFIMKTIFGTKNGRVPAITAKYAWLSFTMLDAEFRLHDCFFWQEFLRQLATSELGNTLENALMKTFKIVNTTQFSPNALVIYKYAELIASIDISHPLFPVLCQRFFQLYLMRVPLDFHDQNFTTYGVSDKFYHHNVSLMKRVRANITAAEEYYTKTSNDNVNEGGLNYFYRSCANIAKSYILWLDGTNLNKCSPYDVNLPAALNSEKLLEIFNGCTEIWTEYINPAKLREAPREKLTKWSKKCFRSLNDALAITPLTIQERLLPTQRIKKLLRSYEARLEPPQYVAPKTISATEINYDILHKVSAQMEILNNAATQFDLKASELSSLSRNYLDHVRGLYKMVPYIEQRHKSCASILFDRRCTRPAEISLSLAHIRRNPDVDRSLKLYLERYMNIVDSLLTQNLTESAHAFEELDAILRTLTSAANRNPELYADIGIQIFYNVLRVMNEVNLRYPLTNELYNQMLNDLSGFLHEQQEREGLTLLQLALKRSDLIKVLASAFAPSRTRPPIFLSIYKLLIESYLKRCDVNVIFVLLSKFDIATWLATFRPSAAEVAELMEMTLQGLECWSQMESELIQDQFRRHLVHIYEYSFPQHYEAVLKAVLVRSSEQKMTPEVLIDLLNSLLLRASCTSVTLATSCVEAEESLLTFALRQELLSLEQILRTITLFTRHFQTERLSHGLHGVYPRHKNYCQPICLWFTCMGHVLTARTVENVAITNPIDYVFGPIAELFAPWNLVYMEDSVQKTAAQWIRRLSENGSQVMQPWSAQYSKFAELLLACFVGLLKHILKKVPNSSRILEHAFHWYTQNFAAETIDKCVLNVTHKAIAELPWELFQPQASHIQSFHECLHMPLPACHDMLGYIFMRIDWGYWMAHTAAALPLTAQPQTRSMLFTVFLRIAYVPSMHENPTTNKLLEDAANYPWHLVKYAELENLMKWFSLEADPGVVLEEPTISNHVDHAAVNLLEVVSGLQPEKTEGVKYASVMTLSVTAKRILYIRTFVRMHRACAIKHNTYLLTEDGQGVYYQSLTKLLNAINAVVTLGMKDMSFEQRKREALNLFIEILAPMQTQSQEISNMHINAMIQWQHCFTPNDAVICALLEAFGHLRTFIDSIYLLMNAAIQCYFCLTGSTWTKLLAHLHTSLPNLELVTAVAGPYHLVLNVVIVFKLESAANVGESISFLEDLVQLLGDIKRSPSTEPELAIIWGTIICRGARLLKESELVKKPLFILARQLQAGALLPDSWKDGLLGAIGWKTDDITNECRILMRCMACIIFAMFPENSQPSDQASSALREFIALMSNKKFAAIGDLMSLSSAILIEHKTPELKDVPSLVYRMIAVFHDKNYLATIRELWEFSN